MKSESNPLPQSDERLLHEDVQEIRRREDQQPEDGIGDGIATDELREAVLKDLKQQQVGEKHGVGKQTEARDEAAKTVVAGLPFGQEREPQGDGDGRNG